MGMLEGYYDSHTRSNSGLKISKMTNENYLLKLKNDDLISRKTLKFIRNQNSVFLG